MKKYHFYHLYVDGEWRHAANEHFRSLEKSMLIDNLEKVFINIVGSGKSTHFEEWVEKFKEKYPGKIELSYSGAGYEQLTIERIIRFLKENQSEEFYVFYAHTKGASKGLDGYAQYSVAWRREMTFHNVVKWQVPVWHLDNGCDTSGAFGLMHNGHSHQNNLRFWAGNFWWAKSEYLRKLPQVSYDSPNEAEYWIGLADIHKYFDLHKGLPLFENFTNSWIIKNMEGCYSL